MPRIELIPEVLYGPLDPIHWEVDNLPLKAILRRQNLINLALDNVIEQMRDAIGTQGSIANRLNQSLNPNGSLKSDAIDESEHSIESHTDTDFYVRMTREESEKLSTIAEEATNIKFQIYTDEANFFDFEEGILSIQPSSTVTASFESPNILKFNMAFPTEAAHQHHYGLEPIHANLVTPDYINYTTTSTATPFIENSLRVFINGMRIYSDIEVYVPGALVDDAWTLLSFTADAENGSFELSSALASEDVIRIDFDTALF
jgi:hypothetical protein